MKNLDFGRYALGISLAAAMLAGCGGSPGQAGAAPVPTLPQSPNGTSQQNLLYVSNAGGVVTVYRYWQRTFVKQLAGFRAPKGECVDSLGDVFVTDSGLEKIREYAHGGAKPINVLDDPGYEPYGCSVDPQTGNLAAANYRTSNRGAGGIVIYKRAAGKGEFYGPIKGLYSPIALGYDDRGNLLIVSLDESSSYDYASFALLPKGSQTFVPVELYQVSSGSPFENVKSLQWDGEYWAIADNGSILRYSIDRSGNATYEGAVALSGAGYAQNQLWITNFPGGSQIVGPVSYSNEVGYWKYPAGGASIATITEFLNDPYGVTVSRRSDEEHTR
ncbi:MAG: hypothetical protein WAK19_01225 [Candidatus Cybelea sp.]